MRAFVLSESSSMFIVPSTELFVVSTGFFW